MTRITEIDFDEDAAARDGLTPIKCPKCKSVLAHMEPDGASVRINKNVTATGRISLPCRKCGSVKTWRASSK